MYLDKKYFDFMFYFRVLCFFFKVGKVFILGIYIEGFEIVGIV